VPAPRISPDEIRALLHLPEPPRLILVSDEFDTWAIGTEEVLKVARSPEHGAKLIAEHRTHDLLHSALGPLVPRVLDHGDLLDSTFTLYEVAVGVHGQTNEGVTVQPGSSLAENVGRAFARLHAVPVVDARARGMVDRDPTVMAIELPQRTLDTCGAIVGRKVLGTFVEDRPPSPVERVSVCHADIKGEHVFVDPRADRLTAIIDWADAAVGDMAQDYAGLVIWLGPMFTRAAVVASGEDDGSLADRAIWLGRYGLLDYWDAVLDGRESAPIPLITQQLRIAFSD
jgi:aminoglycoside phosphotransferase (APT) family kinase protein